MKASSRRRFLTQIEEEYGSDFYLECRIYGAESLSSSEIAELNSDYASYFGTPSDFIEDAVLVDCDMVISAGEELGGVEMRILMW